MIMAAIHVAKGATFGRPRLAPPWRDVVLCRCSLHVDVEKSGMMMDRLKDRFLPIKE